MNRTNFIGVFFAAAVAAVAQTIRACAPVFAGPDGQRTQAPCNGQCPNPTCGVIAEPFHWGNEGFESLYFPVTKARIIRCKRCSTAFWQDAEVRQ